jgi:hypothetical protein
MEGKIEERIKVMGRRGRRSKQLLGKLKDTKTCCKLKDEALECTCEEPAQEEAVDL